MQSAPGLMRVATLRPKNAAMLLSKKTLSWLTTNRFTVNLKVQKNLPKQIIQKHATSGNGLSPIEEKVFSLSNAASTGSTDQENPFVTLKYYQNTFECFSKWEKTELKSFSEFISRLRKLTWRQVLETSGKSSKTGFGYTPYDISTAKSVAKEHLNGVRTIVGDDITFFELRVTQKMRVHGFRMRAAFFLVLLDRDHRVF